ncbi:hypothetical protein R3P38DRAFT_3200900 [Favolaschia claudopus]|uniref:Uncharacterized protein n=1 Tax=Favolaschia claudopus TaxID=2862362 RepID=A0AAW0AZ94_9AGAR
MSYPFAFATLPQPAFASAPQPIQLPGIPSVLPAPAQPVVVVVYASPPPAPAPAPAPAPKAKETKEPAAPPAPKDKTAGFPAPLVKLLRGTDGPFSANEIFSVVPGSSLQSIPEDPVAAEWYTVFRGRFVGVFDQYALADFAVAGVGQGARKQYNTQAEALEAFNKALTWGGVVVI